MKIANGNSVAIGLLVALIVVRIVNCKFTIDFESYLRDHYGPEILELMERNDLNGKTVGSFGGRNAANETLERRPVIFVHGALLSAAFFRTTALYFERHGYKSTELYATTYETNFTRPFMDTDVSCKNIKQIRLFIEAVQNYTEMKVDIISWSLGTLITRKAILGGRCFDTNEELGVPLTDLVETFIAVGGITYGFEDCPQHRIACRQSASIYCRSLLMLELNSQPARFEANFTYSLFALNDQILSSKCCNHTCGTLSNAVLSIGLDEYDHLSILRETMDIQLAFIERPTMADIDSDEATVALHSPALSKGNVIRLRNHWIDSLN